MVEACAVRTDELARYKLIARLISQRIVPIGRIRIPQVFDDLVVFIHQGDSAVEIGNDDIAFLVTVQVDGYFVSRDLTG
jgi:hypothetical protein